MMLFFTSRRQSPPVVLRDYQEKALSMLYAWMGAHDGHPCVVMPTGSGKSVVIAELCRRALVEWPETRIVMLTRSVELIEQNAAKLRAVWPGAPMGIYSASAGQRQIGEPITIGGPLSVVRVTRRLGRCDLLIVDEAHDIAHRDEGSYRKIIKELLQVNPAMRVVGFSATPYRLGHGLITDKPAIFDALLEPASIEELVLKGFLAPLRSKITDAKLDASGVRQRGGEYIESELQAAVDTDDNNERVVREVISLAGDRRAWLFFCAGVQHAHRVADVLRRHGVAAECVTGETPKASRERIIAGFKDGRLRALTNANVLTTGFDYPDIDLIAMLRPTMSPGLYMQMAGRGMRPKSHTDHCLVLDFAGVVALHGPVTAVQPPRKAGSGDGAAPVKVCPQCREMCSLAASICPACGSPFPKPEKPPLELRDDDIMGIALQEMPVTAWQWRVHVSRATGKPLLACTYYGALSDRPITEYFPVLHDGYAGQMATRQLVSIANASGADLSGAATMAGPAGLAYVARQMTGSAHPAQIAYRRDGKFYRVLRRTW